MKKSLTGNLNELQLFLKSLQLIAEKVTGLVDQNSPIYQELFHFVTNANKLLTDSNQLIKANIEQIITQGLIILRTVNNTIDNFYNDFHSICNEVERSIQSITQTTKEVLNEVKLPIRQVNQTIRLL